MLSIEEYMGTANLFFYVPSFGYFYVYDEPGEFGCYIGEFSLQNLLIGELAI